MPKFLNLTLVLLTFSLSVFGQTKQNTPKTIAETIKDCTAYQGYFNFYWNDDKGQILLEIDRWDQEFLYVNSLTGGVGSNDLGLDRNQLGTERIVKFIRSGPKIMLIQPNYKYRAISENKEEKQAVEDAFAQSVLWGFKIVAKEDNRVLIDLTPLLLSDAHNIIGRLKQRKQGVYKLDATRSFVHLDRCKSFPKNSEFDALISFNGDAQGVQIKSVTPTEDLLSVYMHHSFVQLPEPGYTPRVFDPRCGYFPFSYFDYATPIDQPIKKRFVTRHRLEKKDPAAEFSQANEPIVYYLDPGTPEPIRSALLEGVE